MSNMTTEKTIQKALEAVAKKEGVSVESVRREIDIAIAAARKNGDPAIQSFWDSIPTDNDNPLSAEDVIAYLAMMPMKDTA